MFGIGGWWRTAVAIGVSLLVARLTKAGVEDPVRFRARWATGRRGLLTLAAAFAVAAGVWVAVPQPQPGAGTVDIERLTAPYDPGCAEPGRRAGRLRACR
ncbi:hypothetical protein T261_8414 [Streptomyces lydicus]|nr:hypothetical protein T261_8414 [Streptomyces lydicus]